LAERESDNFTRSVRRAGKPIGPSLAPSVGGAMGRPIVTRPPSSSAPLPPRASGCD